MKRPGAIGPARLRAARSLLAQYPFGSYDVVLATLSEQFGFPVDGVKLGQVFERAGWSTPESYMSGAPRAHCPTCRCRKRKEKKP